MTVEWPLALSIITCTVAVIAAIVAIVSYRFARYIQLEVPRRIRRPHTASPWLMDEGKSVRIFPQNIGGEVASNFKVLARFPEDAKIEKLDLGGFILEKGGLANYFVFLSMGRVYPGAWLKPISITAKKGDEEVPPIEVLSWCQEETGFISIPPVPE